jgi:hypothetical protein
MGIDHGEEPSFDERFLGFPLVILWSCGKIGRKTWIFSMKDEGKKGETKTDQ